MADSLAVILADAVAGVVTRNRSGLTFVYDDAYREAGDSVPLSLSMPLQLRNHGDARVRPWLEGLLPDDEAVRRSWARQFHASPSSPFSLLSTPIGQDCAGAVRFVAPENVGDVLARRGEVTWLTDDEVGDRLRELKADATAWLGRAFTGQFSLAGAQPKTALLYREGRWGVPSGSIPTSHILKPAVAGLDDHDLNEHLCLAAARGAGLVAAKTRVARIGGESAIVVERYDRVRIGEDLARVHQEDLCQALSVPPDRKYQNEGGPGPEDITALFRRTLGGARAEEAVRRFIDALIWNWLIGGTDAHAKNYSVLIAPDQVRPAPLYDVASALPYGLHEKKLRFAMKIGNDYRVFSHHNPWQTAASMWGVDYEALDARIRELANVAADAFAEASASPGVAGLNRALPSRLVSLVAERAARCVAILDTDTVRGS